jgi:transketolase
MTLHGGLRPYASTFLVFSDYMRPSIRLAALMGLPVTYVFTHDSIFVGEDGPTHQPVEHLASLRAIPGLTVIRPADAKETVGAWRALLEHGDGPVALLLSRQKVPVLRGTKGAGVACGAYVIVESPDPDVILMASGSEVALAVRAADLLEEDGVGVRVVSMPSWELFERQTESYRRAVLPTEVRARVAIEAAVPFGWERYVGLEGEIIGLARFGASAPYQVLAEKFGFVAEEVSGRAMACVERSR